ncbi:hypothetical protein D3C85_1568810 [compost metagenome]
MIAEIGVVEDLNGNAGGIAIAVQHPLDGLEGKVGAGDLVNMLGGEFAVLVAKVFAQLAEQQVGVDQLHAAAPAGGFGIGQQPDIGGDAGVVEQVVRQLDDGVE